MLRHQENLYKTINITYHGKYTPYPMLSYGPYDCPLCPVKGLYHMMCNIILLVRGGSIVKPVYAPEISQSDAKSPGINFQCNLKDSFWVLSSGGAFQLEVFGLK